MPWENIDFLGCFRLQFFNEVCTKKVLPIKRIVRRKKITENKIWQV